MDLQTLQIIFYTLGIVFMSLMLILMILVVFAVFYIRARVNAIQKQVEEKLENLVDRPVKLATEMGASLASKIQKKLRG